MADFMETVEDFMEDINPFDGKGGKMDKKKAFAVACVGVGAVALFLWWRGNDSDNLGTAYVASGIDGYPTMTPESNDAYYENLLAEQENAFTSELDKVTGELNNALTEQEDYYNNLLGQVSGNYESQLESLKGQYENEFMKLLLQQEQQQRQHTPQRQQQQQQRPEE